MRQRTWTVLAAVAVLLVGAGGVLAHGDTDEADSGHDGDPENASSAEWSTWIEHVTDHMGADAAEQMQERMGTNDEEMGEHMASHRNGSMMDGTGGMGCH